MVADEVVSQRTLASRTKIDVADQTGVKGLFTLQARDAERGVAAAFSQLLGQEVIGVQDELG